jgi:uncharacterized OsmC-like protein
MAEDAVTVAENDAGRYAQDIRAGKHLLHADEPERMGGNDTGPSPYQFLAAALGACTSMTLRMYADRKGWALGRVSVRVHHAKIHAADCAECETRVGLVDEFVREISVDGVLDAEQTARLREIADKCPVHRTLHAEVVVRTVFTGGSAPEPPGRGNGDHD